MNDEIQRARLRNPLRESGELGPGEFSETELEVERIFENKEVQERTEFVPVTYEYYAPFNYPNFRVELGRSDPAGAEYNMDGVELDIPPYGAITFVEEEPIVAVEVIGSACTPPGYVILVGEPLEWKFPRSGVKMKVDNLWGTHIYGHVWKKGIDEGWREAGLSSARFSVPDCSKITILAGSQHHVGRPYPGIDDVFTIPGIGLDMDAHYCVRLIRVTVKGQR